MPTPDVSPFAASLAELEARIAAATEAGDAVPPEAYEMLARLRELNEALASLTSSLEQAPPAGGPPDPKIVDRDEPPSS
jgi:hypothetical protein